MNLIEQHPAISAIAAYFAFSSLVGGMPTPKDTSTSAYQWLYSSLHILAGNLTAAIQARYPQLPAGTTQVTESAQKTVTSIPVSDK